MWVEAINSAVDDYKEYNPEEAKKYYEKITDIEPYMFKSSF